MEFWGVEVKSGEPLTVNLGEGKVLHLSQATLGEVKKDKSNESVCLFVDINGKKLVLGTLNHEKLPQQVFDLVFDKEFKVSHNSKNGSVYFYGYTTSNIFDESDDDDEIDSEDEIPFHVESNGRHETQAKPEPTKPKQAVKVAEPKKDVKPETDDSDEDSDDDEDSDSDSDAPMAEADSDSDEDDESDSDEVSDEEEDEKPKKEVANNNRKRPNEAATKTPGPEKKAKLATPKKSDGKKGAVHVDTPHPKLAGKASANNNKSTPKSAEGSVMCQPCKRSFKSEGALDSHTKAKHSGGK